MKNKKLFISLVVFCTFSFLLFVLGINKVETMVSSQTEQPNLDVKITPSKLSYIQGEVIVLDVEVTNNGSSDIFVKGADVRSGYLNTFIASDDQKFKQYTPGGVRGKTSGFYIKPGQTIKSQATVLWNKKPRPQELGAVYAKDLIKTDYAFPEPSVYLIKASLLIPGETRIVIESVPIQIVVNEPVGNDLKVWNLIKNKPEIGYFLQQDEFRTYKDDEKEKLLKEVKQIAEEYPHGILSNQLGQSLEKFRESEKRRKEFLENLKQRKN
jgi:hypothetical protein